MNKREHPASYLARFDVSPPSTTPLAATAYLTSAFFAETEDAFVAEAQGTRPTDFYTRYGNPTVRAFETAVAHLEGAAAGLATPSGLAGLSATLLALCRPGGRIIVQRAIYAGSRSVVARIGAMIGSEVVVFDSSRPDDLERAIGRGADLVLLETPANPLLDITDLTHAAGICRAHGVLSLVDNTVATPLNQTPLALGCDLVLHSATKTLSGHGDVTAGIICGSKALIDEIWRTSHLLGMALDPFTAWLSIRGLRTLPLRVARQNDTAFALARRLIEHPATAAVYYPGLAEHQGHEVARKQMTGFGSIVSVTLTGGAAAAAAAMSRFEGLRRSASFGGCATLVVRPEAMWTGLPTGAAAPDLPPGLIRFGVGLEDLEDLWQDLEKGLG